MPRVCIKEEQWSMVSQRGRWVGHVKRGIVECTLSEVDEKPLETIKQEE